MWDIHWEVDKVKRMAHNGRNDHKSAELQLRGSLVDSIF